MSQSSIPMINLFQSIIIYSLCIIAVVGSYGIYLFMKSKNNEKAKTKQEAEARRKADEVLRIYPTYSHNRQEWKDEGFCEGVI